MTEDFHLHLDIDLAPVVGQLVTKQVIPLVQAQTVRGLAGLVAKQLAANENLTGADVLETLRQAANFFESHETEPGTD